MQSNLCMLSKGLAWYEADCLYILPYVYILRFMKWIHTFWQSAKKCKNIWIYMNPNYRWNLPLLNQIQLWWVATVTGEALFGYVVSTGTTMWCSFVTVNLIGCIYLLQQIWLGATVNYRRFDWMFLFSIVNLIGSSVLFAVKLIVGWFFCHYSELFDCWDAAKVGQTLWRWNQNEPPIFIQCSLDPGRNSWGYQ